MPTLQQAATLAAYEQRNAPHLGRRKITEQMARDLAEQRAVVFVNEHLSEYEDVEGAIKQYVDTFVEIFRTENGLLTPVQYDAHVQATKDAEEELQRANEWKRPPFNSEAHVAAQAFVASSVYMSIRFTGAALTSEEALEELREQWTKDPEMLQLQRQYSKQYILSYKERIEESLTQIKQTQSKDNKDQQKKKKWWNIF